MGILNTRQGEVCMVAPPLLDVQSSLVCHWFLDVQTKTLIFLLECRWILDHFVVARIRVT